MGLHSYPNAIPRGTRAYTPPDKNYADLDSHHTSTCSRSRLPQKHCTLQAPALVSDFPSDYLTGSTHPHYHTFYQSRYPYTPASPDESAEQSSYGSTIDSSPSQRGPQALYPGDQEPVPIIGSTRPRHPTKKTIGSARLMQHGTAPKATVIQCEMSSVYSPSSLDSSSPRPVHRPSAPKPTAPKLHQKLPVAVPPSPVDTAMPNRCALGLFFPLGHRNEAAHASPPARKPFLKRVKMRLGLSSKRKSGDT